VNKNLPYFTFTRSFRKELYLPSLVWDLVAKLSFATYLGAHRDLVPMLRSLFENAIILKTLFLYAAQTE